MAKNGLCGLCGPERLVWRGGACRFLCGYEVVAFELWKARVPVGRRAAQILLSDGPP